MSALFDLFKISMNTRLTQANNKKSALLELFNVSFKNALQNGGGPFAKNTNIINLLLLLARLPSFTKIISILIEERAVCEDHHPRSVPD